MKKIIISSIAMAILSLNLSAAEQNFCMTSPVKCKEAVNVKETFIPTESIVSYTSLEKIAETKPVLVIFKKDNCKYCNQLITAVNAMDHTDLEKFHIVSVKKDTRLFKEFVSEGYNIFVYPTTYKLDKGRHQAVEMGFKNIEQFKDSIGL